MTTTPYNTIEDIDIFLNCANGTININRLYIELNIFEDIFTNFMTAKISLIDTHDLIKFGPIIGGETVKIVVKSRDNEKIWNFVLYKLDRDQKNSQSESNANILILYLHSPGGFIDILKKPCMSFKGNSADLIKKVVRNILTDSTTPIYSEITKTNLEFIANFWHPGEIIDYIVNNTFTKNHDFLFYENTNGYNFKSLSAIMKAEPFENLEYKDSKEVYFNANTIVSYNISKYFNINELAYNGALGNIYYKFDDNYYKFYISKHDHDSITEFQTNLGKFNSLAANTINNNSNIKLTYLDDVEHIAKRDLILKLVDKYHMVVKLNGRLERTVEQIYKLNFLSKRREDPEIINAHLTGNWLAVQLKHSIMKGVYTQNIKLVKNSFLDKYDENLSSVKGSKNL